MGLKKEIKLLREELRATKEALNSALKRIEELEGIVKEKSIPSFIKRDVKEEPKQSGQKEGHIGYSRHIAEKIVEPEIDEALPNARFGLRLMMLVLILKLDCRIPSNKVTSLLSSVFGIK